MVGRVFWGAFICISVFNSAQGEPELWKANAVLIAGKSFSVTATFPLNIPNVVPDRFVAHLNLLNKTSTPKKWSFMPRPRAAKDNGEREWPYGAQGKILLDRNSQVYLLQKNLPLDVESDWSVQSGDAYSYEIVAYRGNQLLGASKPVEILATPNGEPDSIQLLAPASRSTESFLNTGRDDGPRKLFLVIPVFKELYNMNLAALLVAIANQDLHPFSPDHVHLVFNVNQTVETPQATRTENHETVEFLKALAHGEIPKVRSDDIFLKEASFRILAQGFQIHVVDHTNPGYPSRNIGRVRDDLIKYVFTRIGPEEHENTLIAWSDADSRESPHFLSSLHKTFCDPKIQYALLSLKFGTELGSSLQVFRRLITGDIAFAGYEFLDALQNRLPLSGGPRIIARASAFRAINGVPHSQIGEDRDTITKLHNKFPNGGTWLHQTPVEVSYRARTESYDGAYYLRHLNEPIELTSDDIRIFKKLEAKETQIRTDPNQNIYYKMRLFQLLAEREKAVRLRRALLLTIIHELKNENAIKTTSAKIGEGLFMSPDFSNYLRSVLETTPDALLAVDKVTEHFPHLLRIEPPFESVFHSRLLAITDTLHNIDRVERMLDHQAHPENIALCTNSLASMSLLDKALAMEP
jgi:hypothetical protein